MYTPPSQGSCGTPPDWRHLCLRDVSVPWTQVIDLSTLSLDFWTSTFPSLSNILAILVASPRLRELQLRQNHLTRTDGQTPNAWPAELPHDVVPTQLNQLVRIHLYLSRRRTRHLVVNLRIPSCTSFDISSFNTDVDPQTFDKRQLSHLMPPLEYVLSRSRYPTVDFTDWFTTLCAWSDEDDTGDEKSLMLQIDQGAAGPRRG